MASIVDPCLACSRLSAVTCRDVRAGEELCISYGPLARRHRQRKLRRQLLQQQYYFDCRCAACADDSDTSPVGAHADVVHSVKPHTAHAADGRSVAGDRARPAPDGGDEAPRASSTDSGARDVGRVSAAQARMVEQEGAVCMAHQDLVLEAQACEPRAGRESEEEGSASLRCPKCGPLSADDTATLLGVLKLADQYRQRAEALYDGHDGDSATAEDKAKVKPVHQLCASVRAR